MKEMEEDGRFNRTGMLLAFAGSTRKRSAWLCFFLASAFGLVCVPAFALITGTWAVTNTNSTGSGTNTVAGIQTTVSGYTGQNPSYTGGAGSTFNTSNYWNDPYGGTVAGGPSLQVNLPQRFARGTVITVNFNKPVDNPVIHVDRLGGYTTAQGATRATSSRWTLSGSNSQGGSVTLTRLAGNPQFQVSGNTFQRDVGANNVQVSSNNDCTAAGPSGSNSGTACGSIQFNGTGISSLTFTVDPVGYDPNNLGIIDGLEIGFSFPGSSVTVRKQSNGGTASFPFTLGNLTGSNPTLNTASSNPASSAAFPVANHSQPITLTEGAVSDFSLTSAACVDGNGATVPSTLNSGSRQLSIAAADYGTNQAITCTFINTKRGADLSITKTNNADSVVSGTSTQYTIVASNAGPDAANGAVVRDAASDGLEDCTVVCSSTSGGAQCPASLDAFFGDGSAIPVLPAGSSVTFTATCQVR